MSAFNKTLPASSEVAEFQLTLYTIEKLSMHLNKLL